MAPHTRRRHRVPPLRKGAAARGAPLPTVGHGSRAAVAPEPAADEPASGASLGAKTEPVSEEPVAPSDGEIEELQLGTTEIDLPELKDSES